MLRTWRPLQHAVAFIDAHRQARAVPAHDLRAVVINLIDADGLPEYAPEI